MAHLRGMIHVCDRCGKLQARYELFTNRNDLFGRYCKKCSDSMLRWVEKNEQETADHQDREED